MSNTQQCVPSTYFIFLHLLNMLQRSMLCRSNKFLCKQWKYSAYPKYYWIMPKLNKAQYKKLWYGEKNEMDIRKLMTRGNDVFTPKPFKKDLFRLWNGCHFLRMMVYKIRMISYIHWGATFNFIHTIFALFLWM